MAQKSKGVGKDAPKLVFAGDKWNKKGTYSRDNTNGYFFGQQPSIIRKYICNHLSGQNGNLLKLMWILLSTDENFGISQKWILEESGMEKNKYYQARDDLIDMNWLFYIDDPKEPKLAIDYTFIWAQALLPPREQAPVETFRKRKGQR